MSARPAPELAGGRETAAICVVALLLSGFLVNRVLAAPSDQLFFVWSGALCALYCLAGCVLARPRPGRRSVAVGICAGAALAAVFVLGALVVSLLPPLAETVRTVTAQTVRSPVWAVVAVTAASGVAEELFFRGGLYARLPSRPVLWSTLAYVAVTAASLNPMLTFAAAVLGVVVGLQRRNSGGVIVPIATHVTWSLTMFFALPWILGT